MHLIISPKPSGQPAGATVVDMVQLVVSFQMPSAVHGKAKICVRLSVRLTRRVDESFPVRLITLLAFAIKSQTGVSLST